MGNVAQSPWVLGPGCRGLDAAVCIPHRGSLLACSPSCLPGPRRSGAHQPFCSHHLPASPSPFTIAEESLLFIFGECRGRVERNRALTQDVSPKYFNLAQTSKLVFSFFSLSHPPLEADSIEETSCLDMSGGGMVVEELLGAQKLVIISEMSPAAFEFLVLRPAATCSRVCYL